jgi:alanyl-tRNA synthetase
VFNGETAFKLHDTYGFPLDLTADICRERKRHASTTPPSTPPWRARRNRRAPPASSGWPPALDYDGPATAFHGYDTLETKGNVLALYKDGAPVNELNEGELGVVVLDDTPFYAESGGQVGDRGVLQSVHGIFAVEDTQKIQAAVFGHHGVVKTGKPDRRQRRHGEGRRAGARAHHAQPLGDPPDAQGIARSARRATCSRRARRSIRTRRASTSRITQPMTDAEIRRVENIVNAEILANAANRRHA